MSTTRTTPSTPGELAAGVARSDLPAGEDERFAGYGVMGEPFRSGHVLAVRRFPHNTIGAAYTSVWHCDPEGRWTMWNDASPLSSCPRYFGPALVAVHECPISIEWPDAWTLHVCIDGVLDWRTTIAATASTRLMSAVGSHLPDPMWRNRLVLGAMGRTAGPMLRAGRLRMHGVLPSGQRFRVKIPRLWATDQVSATLRGVDLGPAGPVPHQRWLGDFALPNRGLFAIGRASIETYQPERHHQVIPSAAAN
jgi:hypothetical protein